MALRHGRYLAELLLSITIHYDSHGADYAQDQPEQNKALVLEAFDTLFKQARTMRLQTRSGRYDIQHSAHIASVRRIGLH